MVALTRAATQGRPYDDMEITVLIFLAFALIHSVTVSSWFKERCLRLFGDRFMGAWYRFLYALISFLTVAAAVWLINRIPDRVLWTAPEVLRWPLHGLQAMGLIFGALAFRHLDGLEFLGLRQVWRYLARREVSGNLEGMTERPLVTDGVYGIVRHPLYVAGIILFTFNPRVTEVSLTVTVLADCYFLFGMFIEERRFLRIFGEEYRLQRRPGGQCREPGLSGRKNGRPF